MEKDKIYNLNWRYNLWDDIEGCFPCGSKIKATIKNVARNYAFLYTSEGVDCFLDKRNVKSRWIVNDLTEELEVKEEVECTVLDYNHEKKRLSVSLNMN